MEDEEQMLSVLNRSEGFPIGYLSHAQLDDDNKHTGLSNIEVANRAIEPRVTGISSKENEDKLQFDDNNTASYGKVGGELSLDQEEDYINFDRTHGDQFIPQLVFLESDDNLQNIPEIRDGYQDQNLAQADTDASTLPESIENRNHRSVSESFATSAYNNGQSQNRQLSNDTRDVAHSCQDLKTLRQQSRLSVQSSDSELLTDLFAAPATTLLTTTDYGYTDSEMYTMTDSERNDVYKRLSKWHCHSSDAGLPPDKTARNQLIAVSVLCFLFMIGEAVGGAISNSLALFTDVLHLGSDLISFLISLLAIYLARKPATRKMSFGYLRAEVLGALFSVFVIWSVTGVLFYMAVERIIHQHYKDVKPDEMLITAALGVVFNLIMGFVLHSEMCCGKTQGSGFGHNHSHGSGHSHNNSHHNNGNHGHVALPDNNSNVQSDVYEPLLDADEFREIGVEEPEVVTQVPKTRPKNINVRAAFIHVIGDILQSIGVLIASLIIKLKPEEKYRLADPICTFLFSILVLCTTVTVLRDTLWVIMEGVPKDTNYYDIKIGLQKIPGVKAVHGLTIWCLTMEKNALAVHLAADPDMNAKHILLQASEFLRRDHNFLQTTIQVEDYRPDLMAKCTGCQELHK